MNRVVNSPNILQILIDKPTVIKLVSTQGFDFVLKNLSDYVSQCLTEVLKAEGVTINS